jgi:hypothetical protein
MYSTPSLGASVSVTSSFTQSSATALAATAIGSSGNRTLQVDGLPQSADAMGKAMPRGPASAAAGRHASQRQKYDLGKSFTCFPPWSEGIFKLLLRDPPQQMLQAKLFGRDYARYV